mgnify:CR=1 FL=1
MNESETRAELIDPHLQQQGWAIVPESRIRREYPITKGRLIGSGKRAMPDKADYILQFNNRNVAVLEAKAEVNFGSTNYIEIYRNIKKKVNTFSCVSVDYILKHGLDSFDERSDDILLEKF